LRIKAGETDVSLTVPSATTMFITIIGFIEF
jgi:hypothetical protein